jgi:hypothetical protein
MVEDLGPARVPRAIAEKRARLIDARCETPRAVEGPGDAVA